MRKKEKKLRLAQKGGNGRTIEQELQGGEKY